VFSFGQYTFRIYNNFETSLERIYIDPTGVWEVGEPNKTVFDSSYSKPNSIITDLYIPYQEGITSTFIVSIKEDFGGLPNYLGSYYPLEIDFFHRYLTDSITDYGSIEMSLDNGITWYDVLSNEYNIDYGLHSYYNYHYFESTGDTLYDSLSVYGNSDGWVHSKITKDIGQIIWDNNLFPDSIIVKFSFITDSIGGNAGWQIDNLDFLIRFPSSISEYQDHGELVIYPNPNKGSFILDNTTREKGILRINNLQGQEVYSLEIDSDFRQIIPLNLNPGIYIATLYQSKSIMTTRLVIK